LRRGWQRLNPAHELERRAHNRDASGTPLTSVERMPAAGEVWGTAIVNVKVAACRSSKAADRSAASPITSNDTSQFAR
jgi:hypothetical protein